MHTLYTLAVLLLPILAYEFYTLTQEDLWTISMGLKHLGELNPVVKFVLPALCGHFWLEPPVTLASSLNETAEVFVMALLTWVLFWVFRIEGMEIPYGWVGDFVFIVASVLIGGFVWTIHSTPSV